MASFLQRTHGSSALLAASTMGAQALLPCIISIPLRRAVSAAGLDDTWRVSMRVVFDDQIFSLQSRGGISRYFTNLLTEFGAESDISVQTPFRYVVNHHLHDAFPERFKVLDRPGQLPMRPMLNVLNRLPRQQVEVADIVHHTYYSGRSKLAVYGAKKVCTVHDMIPELFPESFPINPHRGKRKFIEDSDLIICVSETTRRDLIALYGPPDKPIVVTHLGVKAQPNRKPREDVQARYILFVGTRGGYKNFEMLVQALAQLGSGFRDLNLICAGGGPLSPKERRLIARHDLSHRVRHVSPNDTDLMRYYAGASVFCFPSLYEGFGLPLLEAFACGAPAVIARTPALIEVADTAAEILERNDVDSLAASLQRILIDQGRRRQLVEAGRRRAEQFSWSATARKTRAAYELALREC